MSVSQYQSQEFHWYSNYFTNTIVPIISTSSPSTSVASMVISTTVSAREFQGQQSQALLDEPVEVSFTFDEVCFPLIST